MTETSLELMRSRGNKLTNYDVFLSYSNANQPWVREFVDALAASGMPGWYADANGILPGDRWQDQLQKALRQSRVLITVLTPESIRSHWMFFELGAALADKKRIVPVLSEGVEPEDIPSVIRQFQFVREKSPAAAARRVVEAVMQELQIAG